MGLGITALLLVNAGDVGPSGPEDYTRLPEGRKFFSLLKQAFEGMRYN